LALKNCFFAANSMSRAHLLICVVLRRSGFYHNLTLRNLSALLITLIEGSAIAAAADKHPNGGSAFAVLSAKAAGPLPNNVLLTGELLGYL